MRKVLCYVAILTVVTVAFAAEKESALSELDAKIAKSLANDKWHYASKTFVRVVWEDYKKAHLSPKPTDSTRSVFGKMPDVENYSQYIGSFGRRAGAKRSFVEVTKSEGGRFFVKLEGHTIPAVTENRCIVFTTGDVVYSYLPHLGEKPYCTLEMFMLIRTDDTYYFGVPSMPPDKWMELSKLKEVE